MNYVLVITETTETEIPEKTPASKEYEEGVLEAPRFIQTLQQHIDVIESKPVTLECAVVGEPIPTITWYQVRTVALPDRTYVDVRGHKCL